MDQLLRLRQLAGLSTDSKVLAEAKKKFIAKAEATVKVEPPEGLFAEGSKAKIVKWLKANHKDLKSAMSSLNFYINRAGKGLDAERKAVLDSCKEALDKAYAVKESFDLLRKMAGIAILPEAADEVEDSAGKGDEAGEEEEELPSIIKKIAKSAEGKSGEELEDLLMKVYEAGKKDGKKEAEETEGDEEAKEDKVEEAKKHKAKPIDAEDDLEGEEAAAALASKKKAIAADLPAEPKKK